MRKILWLAGGLFSLGILCPAQAQDAQTVQARLVGQPLYLRGMWADNWIEFKGNGKLRGRSKATALTMSGVDVDSVTAKSKTKLLIHAHRVVIKWSPDGTLHRSAVTSKMIFVDEFGHQVVSFSGNFEMKITVHADASGSFEPALHAAFADGLKDMASSAPKYWACWARGYFVDHPDLTTAPLTVDACIQQKSLARAIRHGADGPEFMPPRLIGELELPDAISHRHIKGSDEIAFTVSAHGIAVGFQIRHAYGVGIDEAVLEGLARARFVPASDDGKPVVADMDYLADLTALTN